MKEIQCYEHIQLLRQGNWTCEEQIEPQPQKLFFKIT